MCAKGKKSSGFVLSKSLKYSANKTVKQSGPMKFEFKTVFHSHFEYFYAAQNHK